MNSIFPPPERFSMRTINFRRKIYLIDTSLSESITFHEKKKNRSEMIRTLDLFMTLRRQTETIFHQVHKHMQTVTIPALSLFNKSPCIA